MKRNFLPALIMLIAGAVDCVLSLVQRLSPLAFTKRLLIVLLLFYLLGTIVQWIINANFSEMEEDSESDDEAMDEEDGTDAVNGQDEEELENIDAENSGE